jgi:hypothetical protein
MWLVYFEAANVRKALEYFISSTRPFEVWAKEQIIAFTGIDFNQPPKEPPPEQILSFGY